MLPFFFINACIAPLIGLTGVYASFLLLCVRTGIKMYGLNTLYTYLSAYHIPSFCGALYFSAPTSPRLRLLIISFPVICFMLFAIHPIGSYALPYTAYWIIPLIALAYPHKNFFAHALGSTFITHAVGSVIWLYTRPTTPLYWMSLIPVVIIERLLIAAGMTILYFCYTYLKSYYTKRTTTQNTLELQPLKQ
ncbi:MAG: hypothetical protein WC707_00955 [Candidatus Babeliaceae bacterium]